MLEILPNPPPRGYSPEVPEDGLGGSSQVEEEERKGTQEGGIAYAKVWGVR